MGLLVGRDSTAGVSLISPGKVTFCVNSDNPEHYFIDFLTPTISGVYTLKDINISMVVNGTNGHDKCH